MADEWPQCCKPAASPFKGGEVATPRPEVQNPSLKDDVDARRTTRLHPRRLRSEGAGPRVAGPEGRRRPHLRLARSSIAAWGSAKA